MKELILKVEGMHCSGCENRVKNSLSLIDGIEYVNANHEDGTVIIKLSEEVSLNEIKEAIEDLGFKVKE